MKFEVYRDGKGEWRWRFKAANGKTIAVSSEGYARKSDCEHSIGLVKSASSAPVEEV